MANIIQIRRDTSNNWQNSNPVLAQGEIGIETDNMFIKIGDGVTDWNELRYFVGGYIVYETENNTINIDFNKYGMAVANITENTTIEFNSPISYKQVFLKIVQDSVGGHTITLPAIKTSNGQAITIDTSANNISLLELFYDGVDWILLKLLDKVS